MNKKVLLVDDDKNILDSYRRQLYMQLDLHTAQDAESALIILREKGPFSVVVSDFKMPGMDGIKFLEKVKEIAPDTVRVMLTGYAEVDMAINAVNQGNIFRFLTKPCPIKDFMMIITAAREQYKLICAERELLEQTLKGSIKLLIDILSISNPKEFNQLSRLRDLSKRIGLRLQVDNLWEIELALMLSAIGIITIPGYIIQKKEKGEELLPDEEQMYLLHPLTAKSLLTNIPRLENIAEGIAYQMKNYNGEGPPDDGMKGEEIPVIGRILKTVLDFNSILKKRWSIKYTLDYMQENKDSYDPDVLAALIMEVENLGSWSEKGFETKLISLTDIAVGMILVQDIFDDKGLILLTQGQEITPILRKRLLNFATNKNINNSIRVLQPV